MDELHYKLDYLQAVNKKIASLETMYRNICETSPSAFLYFDFQNETVLTLGKWSDFFSFDFVHTKDFDELYEYYDEQYELKLRETFLLEKTLQTHQSVHVKNRNCNEWHELETDVAYDENQKPVYKIIRFRDITKMKIQNKEMRDMAYFDTLTGLYNRNYFVQLADKMVRTASKKNDIVSILFIDIDGFRKINDGLGILIGDEIVQLFGQFLKTLQHDEHIIVSHFNSDLYCIAVYDPCGCRSVDNICRIIKERCNKPFLLSNRQQLNITVGIGVAEYPEGSDDTLKLINFAEIVMFKAKKQGKNSIQYFDASILNDFLNTIETENQIKESILQERFVVYYQPQYSLKNGHLRGVEALVRIKNTDGTLMSPTKFIPVAEKTGDIIAIGNWVIQESFFVFSELLKHYHSEFILSLNISAIQCQKKDFIPNLLEQMKKYNINPELIELELTESILIDDFEDARKKMTILKEYGIKISLDDFGTGFSSLSYLRDLPIDTLKIDKSFVDTVLTDNSSRIILDSIVSMVEKLGFETIAEGVESQNQMEYLKSIHCDNIQGFLLGKPMDKSDLEQLIVKHNI